MEINMLFNIFVFILFTLLWLAFIAALVASLAWWNLYVFFPW